MWKKIKAWFKHSTTIAWARLQYIGGVIVSGAIVAFSSYDFTQLTTMNKNDVIRMLMAVAATGIVTELFRRRSIPKE